jgi:hypothetical protein
LLLIHLLSRTFIPVYRNIVEKSWRSNGEIVEMAE